MKRYFDILFLGLGLFFLGFGGYLVWERESPRQFVFTTVNTESELTTPIRLTIQSINLDLPVIPATIKNNQWETTKDGVSYLSTSPLPGTRGNSVFYGHNWDNLLGNLKNIKTGDQILVELNNGDIATYRVYFISVVTPDETHIYKNTTDYRLTLYTCIGLLDSKRLVVTAILESKELMP